MLCIKESETLTQHDGISMTHIARLLCVGLVLLLVAPFARAEMRPEMAEYGAAYRGPENLYVYVAHTKEDGHAVIKISGINHSLNNHVFWAKVTYSNSVDSRTLPNRISYSVESAKEEERPGLFIEDSSGTLYLPNYRGQARAEIRVGYDRYESRETQPKHLLTEYNEKRGGN